MNKKNARILYLSVILFSCLFFSGLYFFNSKNTTGTRQPESGTLTLTEQDFEDHTIYFLTKNWEFYYGALLTPEDLQNNDLKGAYAESVNIGDVNNFSYYNPYREAHGCGTYVMHLTLPSEKKRYAIELPEIYSSYILYIDGKMVSSGGSLPETSEKTGYTEGVQTRICSFEASGLCTLLLAAADYSHYYSGMTFAPAIGYEQNILQHTYRNILFYTAISVLCLCIALFTLYAGIRLRLSADSFPDRRDEQQNVFLFSAIALAGMAFTGYPLIHTLFEVRIHPFYTIELCSGYLITLLILILHDRLTTGNGTIDYIVQHVIRGFSIVMCITAAVYSTFSTSLTRKATLLFSALVALYKLCTAAYLLYRSLLTFHMASAGTMPLMAGALFYACSYIWDRIYPHYEPVYGGWFAEWAVIAMILCCGFVLWRKILVNFQRSLLLQKEYAQIRKQTTIQLLHTKKMETALEQNRRIRHDFRHHLTAIKELARINDAASITDYITKLQDYQERTVVKTMVLCENAVVNALLQYHYDRAAGLSVPLTLRLDLGDKTPVPEIEFCIILGNLLENAIDACSTMTPPGSVHATGSYQGRMYILLVENDYTGAVEQSGQRFVSTKHEGSGIGIWSVEMIVKKYSGMMQIRTENGKFSVTLALPD